MAGERFSICVDTAIFNHSLKKCLVSRPLHPLRAIVKRIRANLLYSPIFVTLPLTSCRLWHWCYALLVPCNYLLYTSRKAPHYGDFTVAKYKEYRLQCLATACFPIFLVDKKLQPWYLPTYKFTDFAALITRINLFSEIMLSTAFNSIFQKTICFFVIPVVWHGPYKRDHVGVTNFETSSQTWQDTSQSTSPQRNPFYACFI